MNAARRDHLVTAIWPALEAGTWVVCDRFADSTMAYQGYAGGLKREAIEALHRVTAGDFRPDLTLILDLPPSLGLARARARAGAADRFERRGLDFHEKLRDGYLEIARTEPQRCAVIDAAGEVDTVAAAIRAVVTARLGAPLRPPQAS
jgi:dTMP kinase